MRSKRVRRLETNDMRYLSRIPKNIPPGRVIAHNNILHGPNWPTGPNGFRAWTWRPDQNGRGNQARVFRPSVLTCGPRC